MRVEAVELRRVRLPLVRPFTTTSGSSDSRGSLVVRLLADGGEGWGECVALDAPLYSSEYLDAGQHVTRHHLAPRLLAAEAVGAEDVARLLAPVQGHPMAKAALEMAVLDVELRAAGRSLASRLGATRTEVDCGVAVGVAPSIDALLDEVAGYLDEGYRRVKLKVHPGADLEPVAAVRARFGDVALQVDANGAYSVDQWPLLAALDPFDLLLVEQPVAVDDLLGAAEVIDSSRQTGVRMRRATSAAPSRSSTATGCSTSSRSNGSRAANSGHWSTE